MTAGPMLTVLLVLAFVVWLAYLSRTVRTWQQKLARIVTGTAVGGMLAFATGQIGGDPVAGVIASAAVSGAVVLLVSRFWPAE